MSLRTMNRFGQASKMTRLIRHVAVLALCSAAPALAQESVPAPAWTTTGAFAALRVSDVATIERWYREMLGFETVAKWPARRAALLKRSGSILELIQRDGPLETGSATHAQDLKALGIVKLGFVVDDFEALQASLAAKGVPLLGKVIRSDADGLRLLAIADPEGNLIQFFGK